MHLSSRSLFLPAMALLSLAGLSSTQAAPVVITPPPPIPSVTASAPSSPINAYVATLNGSVTAADSATLKTKGWFEYGVDVPTAHSIVYSIKTPAQAITGTQAISAFVTPLKASTKYHFRVAAQAGTTGIVQYTADQTFTTAAPVALAIGTQPAAFQLVAAGASVSVSVTATGSDPVYQWYKGTAPVAGATGATYTFTASAATGATYTCKVSNPGTTKPLVSDPAEVQVVSINAPASQSVKQGASFSLTASVSPALPHATSYAWAAASPTLTGNGVGTVTNANTATVSVANAVAAVSNAYTCTVTSNGKTASASVNVTVVAKPVITAPANQTFEVSQPVSLPVTVGTTPANTSPIILTAKGLPAGLSVSGHNIVGRPTVGTGGRALTVTLNATNLAGAAASVTYTITVTPLPTTVANTFNGLIQQNSVTGGLGGTATLTVTSTGSYTGSLKVAGVLVPIAGQLDTTTASPTSTIAVVTRRFGNVGLTVTLTPASGKLVGSLTLGQLSALTVTAWAKSPTFAATVPGLHNFYTQTPTTPSATAPQGASFGTATIAASGSVTLATTLADGSVITGATTIGGAGQVPVYGLLYGGKGAAEGWLNVTAKTLPAGYNSVAGTLAWNKTAAASATDYSYPSFDFGVTNTNILTVAGSEQRVVAGDILWAAETGTNKLGVDVTFAGGGISAAAQASDFASAIAASIAKTYGAATVTQPTAKAPGPNVTLSTVGTSGTFSGSFTLTDAVNGVVKPVVRKVTYQGVFAPGVKAGRGFYKLTQLPGAATSEVLSGSVDIVAAP